ncbi:MAG: bifunctional aspartate kinase/homoserine dehydrogenase I [Treponema sp.]|jgi:aspartokinase/homoserine dehydrogenase 1|nr:bifunctional aspartate kinase/homoserine dehydrogenase I [Treponema sp.]
MLILKFGGSSAGSPKGIEQIISILGDKEHAGNVPAVIVTAFSGVTDSLIALANTALSGEKYSKQVEEISNRHIDCASYFLKGLDRKNALKEIEIIIVHLSQILDGISLLRELSPRSLDLVMSFGERLSAQLLAFILCANNIKAVFLDARDLIKTDSKFGKAEILRKETEDNIRAHFKSVKKTVQVVTGFIGSTIEGHTSTIGRGGSDLSAAIFASALGAKKLELWGDVDGIFTADPALVKNAFCIDEISYVEAMEISHFGAKALFPPSVKPALEKGITILIRNTFNYSGSTGQKFEGTKISANAVSGKYPIKGISSISSIALVRIQGTGMFGVAGFSARVFGALARKSISVMLISQSSSEYSICFAILPQDIQEADAILKEEFQNEIRNGSIEKPVIEKDLSIIAVVGSAMKSVSGISGKFFHALGRNGINIVAIAQGSSETNISAVISSADEGKALNAIHDAFFFTQQRSVNLFLIGTGLIGGTLLDQIAENSERLFNKDMIKINLIGAANYDKMLFSLDGLEPKKVKGMLTTAGKVAGTEQIEVGKKGALAFVERMTSLNLPNSCFCDCTASEDIAALYEKILHDSIAIVTPNKKASSGSLDYYTRLTTYSRERGIPYLYECTVGAGLPVISTLRDLFLSGDKVIRIEAILSGTLSFIFNNFDGSIPFSALVREAKAKGYTEPDPRDDLNAMDAARKVLILARECGLSIEFKNVTIEPILPQSCFNAKDIDAFFAELQKSDADYEKRRAKADAEGKKLRYIAVIEEGKAKLSLRAEGEESPFTKLVDSDNMVVITTNRYSKLPMVIKGPGAGAQVTAGGVFADIVRIARTLV